MREKMTGPADHRRLENPDNLVRRARSFACRRGWIELAPRAHRLIGKALFDPDRRVIMDWSGKAGCTIGTMMFFRQMGLLEEAREYHPWIHDFRKEVFYGRCPVTARDLLSRKNVLFKVVRNPFTRVISSLRNKVRVPGKNRKIFEALDLDTVEAITFRQFVGFLESIDLRVKCDVHYREQVQDYELLNLRRPFVCKLENLKEDIAALNRRYGFEFDPEGLTSEHHAMKNDRWTGFAGDIPWCEFGEELPDYRFFYNRELRERVSRLYRRDLNAYGYAFPWNSVAEDSEQDLTPDS